MDLEPSSSEKKALAFFPKFCSLLSLAASIYVASSISRNGNRKVRAYHRMAFGLSIMTSVLSIACFVGTWAIPKGITYVYGARGNYVTCQIQGFIINYAGYASAFYYSSFSIIAFLSVRNSFVKEKILKTERFIHISVVIVPFVISIVASFNNYLNPSFSWCRISDFPPGCHSNDKITCLVEQKGFKRYNLCSVCIIATYLTIQSTFILALNISVKKQRLKYMKRQDKSIEVEKILENKVQLVRRQSILYVTMSYIIYVFTVIIRSVSVWVGNILYPFLTIVHCNMALAGFYFSISYTILRLGVSDEQQCEDEVQEDRNVFRKCLWRIRLYFGTETLDPEQRPCFSIFDGSTESSPSPWVDFNYPHYNERSRSQRITIEAGAIPGSRSSSTTIKG